ncbi:MAG: citrate/2-methylcitrate synthase, partial [Psychromonas sp.]
MNNKHSLTITDNRTGKSYEIPIQYGTYPNYGAAINALELRNIKTSEQDFGLLAYDPGFTNTASCSSSVTFLDGEKGILRYRGYPIEQLAEKSTYLETAYLILNGELPNNTQLNCWQKEVIEHTFVHENIKKFIDRFQYDAHPMGTLVSTVGALSTFYPDAKNIHDQDCRKKQIWRLIAKMPTLAAFAYRHSLGLPYIYPDQELSYVG